MTSATTRPRGLDTFASRGAWPGEERRSPKRSDRHYLMLEPLARALEGELASVMPGRDNLRVLDLGCGCKPYLPLIAERAASYRGLDLQPGSLVDDVGVLEALPYDDASADVVLCTQVLEHVEDPAAAVSEIGRVLAPGGTALVSTHGVFVYHPDPPELGRDYWRWTHAGLRRLFETTSEWEEIRVTPGGEAIACIAYILCQYVDEAGQRLGSERVRRGMLAALNSAASRLDRRLPPRARGDRPGSISANYLVSARRAAA